VRIAVGETEQEGNSIFRTSFHEEILLKPGEPMPERWQHLFALEEFAVEGVGDE